MASAAPEVPIVTDEQLYEQMSRNIRYQLVREARDLKNARRRRG